MEEYVNAWPFDYVIGSMHVIDGKDPYYEDEMCIRDRRKMEAEKESITTMPHPAARQIFARLESFLARYDATKRESTVCMPPAPRESISA